MKKQRKSVIEIEMVLILSSVMNVKIMRIIEEWKDKFVKIGGV
jgi:hypothetical protein